MYIPYQIDSGHEGFFYRCRLPSRSWYSACGQWRWSPSIHWPCKLEGQWGRHYQATCVQAILGLCLFSHSSASNLLDNLIR